MLQSIALYLSFVMSVFLFVYAFIDGINIANSTDKVYGGTFIFSIVSGFIFAGFTHLLI